MAKNEPKRFTTLKNYKGIRKDNFTNTFVATKSINGKRFYSSFALMKDALHWKNTFHPILTPELSTDKDLSEKNGRATRRTFNDVWEMFLNQHILSKEVSTRETYEYLVNVFSSEKETPINHFTPDFLNILIERIKLEHIKKSSKRKNFKAPLKMLKTMFNWYRENYDPTFLCPVLKRHFVIGKIEDITPKNKKMTDEQVISFFNHLPDFYKDIATVHFYIAGRVQEVAGIQRSNINLKERSLLIKDVVVWSRHNRKVVKLKTHTKNGEIRYAYLNDSMVEILKRKLNEPSFGSQYVFHKEGQPLSYRQIQAAYNRALKAAALTQFSSTHIMRHSMATLTRKVTKSLEATQAVTGHKDQKLVQHYASMPESSQMEAVTSVEKHIKSLLQ